MSRRGGLQRRSTCRNGHPKGVGNTRKDGGCLECQQAANRRYRASLRPPTASASSRPTVPPLRLPDTPYTVPLASLDPRTLYQIEKAKRADRKRPEMEAAQRVWKAQMDAEKAARKGGRPPKIFVVGKQRPKELADLLPKFTHGHSSDRA